MLVATALVLSSCATGSSADDRPKVVATTTILGDVVAHIAGDEADVTVLMQPGQDPHGFQASASQAATMVDADLIVVNGLDLEEGLEDVIDNAASAGVTVLSLGEQLDPLPWEAAVSDEHEHEDADSATSDEHEHEHEHTVDPHWWLDPVRMAQAAELIGGALGAADPANADDWTQRAAAYSDTVLATHDELVTILAAVPPERRLLVTNHNALRYFATRYGFEIVGTVIPSGTTLAAPSPADLADLVATLNDLGLDAVFAETTQPTALADAVAAELSRPVEVVQIYTGSLGPPDSDGADYLSMMRTDARRIAAALAD
jgi:zinc/manganese transport system substrate-binding protein